MRRIITLAFAIFLITSCTKEDFNTSTSQAASARKGIPALSETWINGALAEKYEYTNGRLVRFKSGGVELVYTYTDKDHYTVMTGDYMYAHFYYNEDHQLIQMVVGDEDGQNIWVRHTFTWEKDRILTHTWAMGNLTGGTYGVSEDNYIYRTPFDFQVESFHMDYRDGQLVFRENAGTSHYKWHTPFEFRTGDDPRNYESSVYSNTIKMPQYNIAAFPWGYYSIDDTHKRDLMNMVATNWSRTYLSGMLLLEKVKVVEGKKQIITQVQNLVVNSDKLPVSYDVVSGATNAITHYQFKYITL